MVFVVDAKAKSNPKEIFVITKLAGEVSLDLIQEKLNEVIDALNKAADRRGPKSEREMSDADARAVISGSYAKASHKEAAERLGLSYAQVYSCRKEFTFKHIHREVREAARKAAEEAAKAQQEGQ